MHKKITAKKPLSKSAQERQDAKDKLLGWLKRGDRVYTILRYVSKSGMMRHIDALVFLKGQPVYLSYNVAKLLDWPLAQSQGVKVDGAGMDMGFHLVYTLSYALFGAGDQLKHEWL